MQPYHDAATLERQYELLLSASSCNDIFCLRSLPMATLAIASQETYKTGFAAGDYGFGDFFYGPSVDGTIIKDLPSNEFSKGKFAKVPLMTDREGYEGLIFSNPAEMTPAEESADLKILFPNSGDSFFNQLYKLYPGSDFNSTFYQRVKIFGDAIICCLTYNISAAVADSGNPVYKMVFDAGTQVHGSLIAFTETLALACKYEFHLSRFKHCNF